MKRLYLSACLAVVMAGCVSPEIKDSARWYKPGASPAQTSQDLAAARLYAQSMGGQLMYGGIMGLKELQRRDGMVRDGMLAKGYTLRTSR